jgi:type IV pilus assembly protein PilY1
MNSFVSNFLKGLAPWHAKRVGTSALAIALGIASQSVSAVTDPGVPLSDSPLFSAAQVPANLLLELSVEYPTALSIANSQAFNPAANVYVGYFDPNLCYTYVYSTSSLDGTQTIDTNHNDGAATATKASYYLENANQNDSGDYFKPAALAGAAGGSTAGQCDGTKWSGAFLNWAGMQTIDPFRWALTGGYRSYDVATATTTSAPSTVLKKAWASGDGGSGETPVTYIYNPQLYTPLPANINTIYGAPVMFIRLWGLGTRMQFTGNYSAINGNNQDTSESAWTFSGAGDVATNLALVAGSMYSVKIRVSACDNSLIPSYTLPSYCTKYANNYKPEGLIQEYSTAKTTNNVYVPPQIRFAAMGYLNDSSIYRDAGVLRAKMKFLGPTSPTPGNVAATNANPEWDPNSGVFFQDPDPTDTAATNALGSCTDNNGKAANCASYSGVTNYLNGFGEITHKYKTYDPVDELYYAGIRYFKADGNGGGNVASWSDLTGLSSGALYQQIDQFPVIQTWDDPIIYACQKNFVLGIGDVNAHAGGNIPGGGASALPQYSSGDEPTMPSAVAADNTVGTGAGTGVSGSGAVKATNYIGSFETGSIGGYNIGGSSLGNTNVPWCCGDDNTFLMAGLAYDAHVADMRPNDFLTNDNLDANGNKLQIQTLSTYWLDVQEYQHYYYRNMFWLAAKWGGFNIESNYVPYGAAAPLQSDWSNSTDYAQGQPNTSSPGNPQPNNYYGAGNAQAMVNGLTNAFASIATSAAATTTGLASSNYNSVGTSFGSYAVQYDEATWSSDVTAYSTLFGANGQPTTTPVWDSRAIVSGYSVTSGNTTTTYLGQFGVTNCGTLGTNHTYGWKAPSTGSCPSSGSRVVVTYNPTSAVGAAFEVGSLTTAQTNALKAVSYSTLPVNNTNITPLLSYLRGDKTNEYPAGYQFRPRTYLQGDVVNSSLVPVGPPNLFYTQTNDPGYPAFAAGTAANRSTVVYVGANDGMLHAYQGSLTPSTQGTNSFAAAGGSEMFAYVPSGTYLGPDGVATDAGLAALATPRFHHHYYVDSTPVVTDIDLANTNRVQSGVGPTPNWISILVGGMGKGGQSYYALNVTNPDAMAVSETAAASKVMWEFTDPTMGYTFGQPVIAKTQRFGWTVLVLSGMNACTSLPLVGNCAGLGTDTASGHSYVYLINPAATGGASNQLYLPPILVSASVGTPAAPEGASFGSALQDSTDGGIDALYFGDLYGYLWRLDLRYGALASPNAYTAPDLIAILTDSGNNPQPVTTRPAISVDPNTGNRYVSVGTGQLLSSADLNTTNQTHQQSFYTIFDGTGTTFAPATAGNTNFPVSRAGTSPRSLVSLNGVPNAATVCGVQTKLVPTVFSAVNGGWYFDVGVYGSSTVACRMNIAPAIDNQGSVTFAANIPSGSVCNPSGSNQIFAFGLADGRPLIVDGNGNVLAGGYTAAGGAVSSFSLFNNNGSSSTQATTNGGTNSTVPVAPPSDPILNRLNWREVPAVD